MEYNKFGSKQGRKLSTRGPRDHQRKQRQMEQANVFQGESIEALMKEISGLKKQMAENNSQEPTGQMFTAEQVDERINKAVVESVEEVKDYYGRQMKELREALKPADEVKKLRRTNSSLKVKFEDSERERKQAIDTAKLLDHTLKLRDKEIDKKNVEIKKLESKNVELETVKDSMDSDMGGLKEMLAETTKKMETLMAISHEGTDYQDPDRPQMEEIFIDPIEREERFETFIDVRDVDETSKVSMDEKVNKLKSLFGDKIPS